MKELIFAGVPEKELAAFSTGVLEALDLLGVKVEHDETSPPDDAGEATYKVMVVDDPKPDKRYGEQVHVERLVSAIAGKGTEITTLTEMISDGGILKAFALDDDIQQLTVASTNLIMVRRYTKSFKKEMT